MNINLIKLKIRIEDIEPQIYRRVLVSAKFSLLDLHQIIQICFGWEDQHLFIFNIGDMRFVNTIHWEEDAFRYQDASRALLSELIPKHIPVGGKFTYVYDLGDGWQHEILVEDLENSDEDLEIPICYDGRRSAPPENFGGPFLYHEYSESLKGPRVSKFDDSFVYFPEGFDPEKFEIKVIGRKLIRNFQKEDDEEKSSWSTEVQDFNPISDFGSDWTKRISPEHSVFSESLPFRQDLVTMLTYLKGNRVKGTQATGNFPLKHIRKMTTQFVNPPELDQQIGDKLYKLRTEDEVPYLVFLHNFANIAQLILGGEGLQWQVSYVGERFLEHKPEEQIWFMCKNWFQRFNWFYWHSWDDYDALIEHHEFQGMIIDLLLSYPTNKAINIQEMIADLDEKSPNWIRLRRKDYQLNHKKHFLINVVVDPLEKLGIIQVEREDDPDSPKYFVNDFQVTDFGKSIIKSFLD